MLSQEAAVFSFIDKSVFSEIWGSRDQSPERTQDISLLGMPNVGADKAALAEFSQSEAGDGWIREVEHWLDWGLTKVQRLWAVLCAGPPASCLVACH